MILRFRRMESCTNMDMGEPGLTLSLITQTSIIEAGYNSNCGFEAKQLDSSRTHIASKHVGQLKSVTTSHGHQGDTLKHPSMDSVNHADTKSGQECVLVCSFDDPKTNSL